MRLQKLLDIKMGVFGSFLISYVLIFMIPVVISMAVYFEVIKIVEKDTVDTNISLINQMKDSADQLLMDIEKVSMEISFNKELNRISTFSDYISNEERYMLLQMANELKWYKLTSTYINDIYVYQQKSNFAVGTSGSYGDEKLYLSYFEGTNLTYDEWYELMQDKNDRIYLPISETTFDGIVRRFIMYVQPVNVGTIQNPWDKLTINISQTRFEEGLKSLNISDKSNAFIIDKYNNVIEMPGGSRADTGITYDELVEDNGTLNKTIDGKKYIISYCSSEVNDWKYVMVFPVATYMKKVVYVRNLVLYSILLCVGVGLCSVYYFSKRNYNEIREIATLFSNASNTFLGSGNNELHYIKDKIKQTLSNHEDAKVKLEKQKDVLKSKFLTDLLRGKNLQQLSKTEDFSTFEPYFSARYFAVMVLQVEDYSEIFFGDMDGHDNEKYENAIFIITNVVENLAAELQRGLVTEIDEMLACIFSIKDMEIETVFENLNQIAEQAQDFVKREFNVRFSVSISNIHSGMSGVSTAYNEALQALQYKMVLGKNKIIGYEQIKSCNGNYTYTIEDEQKLINCIKAGAFEDTKNIITKIFESNFKDGILPVQMAKCLIFDIVSTIVKILGHLKIDKDDEAFSELNIVDSILSADTVDEMRMQLLYATQMICEYVSSSRKTQNMTIVDDMKAYIENHYMDFSLNISDMSENFGLTGPYLSKLFKLQLGESLLDYIHKIRLGKAKTLLHEGLSINEVAERVGYNNSNAFIRIFKKYERITPGQYKEIKVSD